jgi:hypothetical protein
MSPQERGEEIDIGRSDQTRVAEILCANSLCHHSHSMRYRELLQRLIVCAVALEPKPFLAST